MKQRNSPGFSLMEVVLYVGIGAIMLGAVTAFYFSIQTAGLKNQTILEIEEGGTAALAPMLQAARSATGVTGLGRGRSTSVLTLRMTDQSRNPTVFDVSNGVLRVREGRAGVPVPLTVPRVRVARFLVTNVAPAGSSAVLRFELTLTAVNPSGRNEYDYGRTFLGTAALRP